MQHHRYQRCSGACDNRVTHVYSRLASGGARRGAQPNQDVPAYLVLLPGGLRECNSGSTFESLCELQPCIDSFLGLNIFTFCINTHDYFHCCDQRLRRWMRERKCEIGMLRSSCNSMPAEVRVLFCLFFCYCCSAVWYVTWARHVRRALRAAMLWMLLCRGEGAGLP